MDIAAIAGAAIVVLFVLSQRVTMQRKKSIYFGSLCRTTSYSSTPAATEAFRLSA